MVHSFIIREIGGMTFFRALFCNLPAELTATDLEIPEIKWDIFQKVTKRSPMFDNQQLYKSFGQKAWVHSKIGKLHMYANPFKS